MEWPLRLWKHNGISPAGLRYLLDDGLPAIFCPISPRATSQKTHRQWCLFLNIKTRPTGMIRAISLPTQQIVQGDHWPGKVNKGEQTVSPDLWHTSEMNHHSPQLLAFFTHLHPLRFAIHSVASGRITDALPFKHQSHLQAYIEDRNSDHNPWRREMNVG